MEKQQTCILHLADPKSVEFLANSLQLAVNFTLFSNLAGAIYFIWI